MDDIKEIEEIQKKMAECVRTITRLTSRVGMARQVKEFNADQRKNALAAEQIKFIQRGESVAASENLARSSPVYLQKFAALGKDYAEACATIAEWEAAFARLEAARSVHAMFKETLKL